MSRLLVFGAGGQVGRELLDTRLQGQFIVEGRDRAAVDIVDAEAVEYCIVETAPNFVVNAAAYTAVDRAESESGPAFAVNERGAGNVADACARHGVPLLHLSTDYVFDGAKPAPYVEDDLVNPLSVYGASKEAGERAVRAGHAQHVILRTSWVFAAHGANFVRTMLRLGRERADLRIVADQHGGPTAASDIAAACVAIAAAVLSGRRVWGTYHYAGAPVTDWHAFATAIFAAVAERGAAVPKLTAITTADYLTAARRPANSVLDCGKIGREFGLAQPDWRPAVARIVGVLMDGAGQARGTTA